MENLKNKFTEKKTQIVDIIKKNAYKQPKEQSFMEKIVYNVNQICSLGFESVLLTDIPINYENHAQLSLFMKPVLIIVTYITLSLFTMLFSTIVPIYYATYLTDYSYFKGFLYKQLLLFQDKLSTKPLLTGYDELTVRIQAWYPVILDPKYNDSTTIDIKSPTSFQAWLDTNLNQSHFDKIAYPYFLGLVDEYKSYVKNKEIFTIQAIQLWIIMFCTILFLIPIKYISYVSSTFSPASSAVLE